MAKANIKRWTLREQAQFILDNTTLPCGGLVRIHRDCVSFDGQECADWKAPVRDDGRFSQCWMDAMTRRILRKVANGEFVLKYEAAQAGGEP